MTRAQIAAIKNTLRGLAVAIEDAISDSAPIVDDPLLAGATDSPTLLQAPRGNLLEVVDISVIDDPVAVVAFYTAWFSTNEYDVVGYFDTYQKELRAFPNASQEDIMKSAQARQFVPNGRFPIIDIKLKSNAQSPVFLKRLEFKTTLRECRRVAPQPNDLKDLSPRASLHPSWGYNVLFNADEGHATIDLPLSQVIPANEVDRFVVFVGATGPEDFERIVFDFKAKLFFNQYGEKPLGNFSIKFTDNSGGPQIVFDKRRQEEQFGSGSIRHIEII